MNGPADHRALRTWSFVLIALALALSLPFIGGGFYTDDFLHVSHLRAHGWRDLFSQPDVFGFYRPVTQASLFVDLWLYGDWAPGYRLTNVLLHIMVIAAGILAGRAVLDSTPAALFAALAFVLVPKASPIAVLWASARADLLAALFSFVCVILWIAWTRGSGLSLVGFVVAYVLAFLAKETAAALPALLILLPAGNRTFSTRLSAALGLLLVGVAVVALRMRLDALMPWSDDPHYGWVQSPRRWLHNGWNYFRRALPSPAVLLVIVGAAELRGRPGVRVARSTSVALLSVAWFTIFIGPALGIAARSELYLYLPTYGLCLFAGYIISALITGPVRSSTRVAVLVCIVVLSGFQMVRSRAIHRDLVFSDRFSRALQDSEPARLARAIRIVPGDPETARFIRDAFGGYVDAVVKAALHRQDVVATIGTPDAANDEATLGLICHYNGRIVAFSR